METLTGVLAGDVGNVSLTGGTATFADANVGNGIVVTDAGLGLTGALASDYSLSNTSETTTANITPLAITGSITASNKTYDGGTSAAIATKSLTGVLPGDVGNVSLTGGTANFAGANVANGIVVTDSGLSLTGSAASNYSLSNPTETTTANITPLAITGSITASNKTYDGGTSATIATKTLTGVLLADVGSVSLTGGTASFGSANVANGITVTDAGLSLTGSAAGNYSLSNTTETTTANITPLAISGNIIAGNKTYDGGAVAVITSATLTGVLAGDVGSGSLTGGAASFASANVANGITVTDTGLSLTGTLAGDYSLSNPTETATANITPLAITGSITAGNKVYDGGTAVSITSEILTGVLPGDAGSVSLTGGKRQLCRCECGQWHNGPLDTGLSLTGAAWPVTTRCRTRPRQLTRTLRRCRSQAALRPVTSGL